jgi:DNA-binding MarR family transcriptional regulator
MARLPPPGLPRDRRVAVANRLNSSAIRLLRRISQEDGADGLTGPRASALSVLVYGGPATVGELARRERVAVPTMSRLVDALVREGMVGRGPAPGDRRVVRLTATANGRTTMERGRARRIRRLAAELEALGADDLDVLERALDLLDGLEAGVPGGDTNRVTGNEGSGLSRRAQKPNESAGRRSESRRSQVRGGR